MTYFVVNRKRSMSNIVCGIILLLVLVSDWPTPALTDCRTRTCMNGGSCEQSSYGFKCKCPKEGEVDYGPRCELAIRGYVSSFPTERGQKYILTKHRLSGYPFHPEYLNFSFEFAAHCHTPPCKLFVIQDQSGNALVTVEMSPTTENRSILFFYRENHNAEPKPGLGLLSTPFWSQRWKTLSVYMRKVDSNFVVQRSVVGSAVSELGINGLSSRYVYSGDFLTNFIQSELLIGRMFGCIRSVRVNGVLVDLAKVDGYVPSSGDLAKYTMPYCPFFKFSCLKFTSDTRKFERNFCGKDSQCNGEVNEQFSNYGDTSCTCRCINGKRRRLETITNNDRCAGTPEPANECSLEAPVISSKWDQARVEWSMSNRSPFPLLDYVQTLEAFFRTAELDVPRAFEFAIGASKLETCYVKISQGFLHACCKAVCSAFPTAFVSDDQWHSFSLVLGFYKQIITTLDTVSTLARFSFQQPTITTLTMQFPQSCVRAVRWMNIYMPTGGADNTSDNASSFITVNKDSGISVGSSCFIVPRPVCNCSRNEDCDATSERVLSSGVAVCTCKNGLIRNSSGDCIVPNACSQCAQNEYCDTSTGAPICNCKTLFSRDSLGNCVESVTCKDCKKHEDCDASSGMPKCVCRQGYAKDPSGDCQLIAGCRCMENEVCDHSSGQPRCKCATGFEVDSANNCVSPSVNYANRICDATSGQLKCSCRDGFAADSAGICMPVKSCSQCTEYENCDMSSEVPSCKCIEGFVKADDGSCVMNTNLLKKYFRDHSYTVRPDAATVLVSVIVFLISQSERTSRQCLILQ